MMSGCSVTPQYSFALHACQVTLDTASKVSLYDWGMNDLKQVIADWIREARESASLSQEALGARLGDELGNDGYTRAAVSSWETAKHEPGIQLLLAIKAITRHPLPSTLLQLLGYSSLNDVHQQPANSGGLTAEDLAKVVNGFCVAGPEERNLILSAVTAAIENAALRRGRASSDKN